MAVNVSSILNTFSVLFLGLFLVFTGCTNQISNEMESSISEGSSDSESSSSQRSESSSVSEQSVDSESSSQNGSSSSLDESSEQESSSELESSTPVSSSIQESSSMQQSSSDNSSASVSSSSQPLSSSEAVSSSSENVWGIQMYTFRDELGSKFKETLQFIKTSGYDQIELAGYYGQTAETLYEWGQEIGVEYISTHHTTAPLRDSLTELMADAKTLKADFMVLAWLAPEERNSIDKFKALAQELNSWGATLKENGLKMVYHNHEFEFQSLDGEIPYEVLLADTDPDLVYFQLDVAWAYQSGIDPLKYYKLTPERFPLFHLKDMDAPGATLVLDLGEGNIDYPTILPELLAHPNQYYFIEHDHTLDPHKTIETNMTYLKSLGL